MAVISMKMIMFLH